VLGGGQGAEAHRLIAALGMPLLTVYSTAVAPHWWVLLQEVKPCKSSQEQQANLESLPYLVSCLKEEWKEGGSAGKGSPLSSRSRRMSQ